MLQHLQTKSPIKVIFLFIFSNGGTVTPSSQQVHEAALCQDRKLPPAIINIIIFFKIYNYIIIIGSMVAVWSIAMSRGKISKPQKDELQQNTLNLFQPFCSDPKHRRVHSTSWLVGEENRDVMALMKSPLSMQRGQDCESDPPVENKQTKKNLVIAKHLHGV